MSHSTYWRTRSGIDPQNLPGRTLIARAHDLVAHVVQLGAKSVDDLCTQLCSERPEDGESWQTLCEKVKDATERTNGRLAAEAPDVPALGPVGQTSTLAAKLLSRSYRVDRDELIHAFDLAVQEQKFNEALLKQPPSHIVAYVTPARDAYLVQSYVVPRLKRLATLRRTKTNLVYREITLRKADLANKPLGAALVTLKLAEGYDSLQLADLFDDESECLFVIINDDLPADCLQQVALSFWDELQALWKSLNKPNEPPGRYLVLVWVNLIGEPLQLNDAGEIPALGYLSRQEVINFLEDRLPQMGIANPDVAPTILFLKNNLSDDPAPLYRIYLALEKVCKFLQRGGT